MQVKNQNAAKEVESGHTVSKSGRTDLRNTMPLQSSGRKRKGGEVDSKSSSYVTYHQLNSQRFSLANASKMQEVKERDNSWDSENGGKEQKSNGSGQGPSRNTAYNKYSLKK